MNGKMKPKYSGGLSRKFWDRINNIKPERLHDAIYLAGCALQDHEGRVLRMIANAEQSSRRSK